MNEKNLLIGKIKMTTRFDHFQYKYALKINEDLLIEFLGSNRNRHILERNLKEGFCDLYLNISN